MLNTEIHSDLIHSRAFQHADGFFTSFLMLSNKVPALELHNKRLLHSCSILKAEPPDCLKSFKKFKAYLKKECQQNKLEHARIKLMFWRKEGKAYSIPENSTLDYVFLYERIQPSIQPLDVHLVDVSIPRIPTVCMDSSVKWLNGVNSILAQHEAAQKKGNMALQTTLDGYVSEASYACVVWVDENGFNTPSGDCDTLNGTCLNHFIRFCSIKNVTINSVKVLRESIQSADWIVFNAVQGAKVISSLNGVIQNVQKSTQELIDAFNTWRWDVADSIYD